MSILKRLVLPALMVGGCLALAGPASAQFTFRTIPSAQQRNPVNPYWLVAPGVTQAQYLASVRAYARTAATIPPWLYGYNPYPNPIISTGPVIPTPVYGGGVNPYYPSYPAYPGITNPYTPGVGAGSAYTNPYTPVGSGYDAGYYPSGYGYYPSYGMGGTLAGSADVIRAYGSYMTSAEQARIMRETAYQARLDTERKRFDLEMYIKQNTPTFTEEQARIAAITLKRIQTNALDSEVTSGKSLNILLDDLRKFPGKKVSTDMGPIGEEVLLNLNVTSSAGAVGLLRDGKVPDWPAALQEILEPADRVKLDGQLVEMVRRVKAKESLDAASLTKLRKTLDQARERLGEKINDIPTSEYLTAKRFLNDLDQARIAFERGEARHQFEYMDWVKAGAGKLSAQDLADYMTKRGLKVAPATMYDDAAYRAAYSALAALDVQINAHFAAAAPEYKE